jgi:uncharacterized OsmC-like protein
MIRGECTSRGVVGRRTRFGLRDSNGHEHRAHAGLALDSHLRHSAATARPYRRTKGVALCAGIAAAEAVLTRASECIPGARAVSTMHAVQTSQRLAAGLRHRDAVGMDATELRELQSPLKRKYRDDPAAAATPLRAEGDFCAGGITATVSGWAGPVRAGLHPATGGDGSDACSGDMLLQAVLACAGVTLRSVATALGINVRRADLGAVASFDARGTLGVSREAPVGIQGLVITARLDTDAGEAELAKLGELTERYCVVGQSLAEIPRIVVTRAAD